MSGSNVRLFFVLSGFLVTTILLKARDENPDRRQILKAFFARRAIRIFPLYYLALGVALVGTWHARDGFWWHMTFLTNVRAVIEKRFDEGTGHFWSMAVEEQFYLAWPLVVLFVPKRHMAAAVCLAVALGPLSRLAGYHVLATSFVGFLMPCCLDAFGMGAGLALVRRSGPEATRRLCWAAGLSGLAVVAWCLAAPPPRDIRLAMFGLGQSLALTALVGMVAGGHLGTGRLFSWGPLTALGTVSYGVFAWHGVLPAVAGRLGVPLPDRGLALFAAVTAASLAAAAVTWRYYEKPLNGLKRLFPYGPPQNSTSAIQGGPPSK